MSTSEQQNKGKEDNWIQAKEGLQFFLLFRAFPPQPRRLNWIPWCNGIDLIEQIGGDLVLESDR